MNYINIGDYYYVKMRAYYFVNRIIYNPPRIQESLGDTYTQILLNIISPFVFSTRNYNKKKGNTK